MTDNPLLETAEQFYNAGESEQKPTETTDVTTVQETEQDVELAKPEEAEDKTEVEAVESEATDEEKESQFIELDGKEIDLDDVRDWRDNGLMQKDYTKKTTLLSNERKSFEVERSTERETIAQEKSKIIEMQDMLTVLVQEDAAIDWVELKEDEPERYIELKEKADQRKAALEKVKAERNTPVDDPALIQTEARKLFEANPTWVEDGNVTEAYQTETALMNEYAMKAGFQPDEFANLNRAHYLQTILKAAKYDELQEKGRKIKEKREKVPVVLKPKGEVKSEQPKDAVSIMYG